MKQRRRLAHWLGGALGALVLAAIVLAPSWRNYYLRRGAVRVLEDQPYLPGDANPRHRLDLYLPTAAARPWPVVVFVHGGFWRPFDRRMFQPFTGLHGCVGVALANRGIATAVVGYRQRPEAASIEDALDDVARAVRYVVDTIGRQGGDPARVYLVGHSAGGLVTSLLALEPEHLARAGVPPGSIRGFASLAGPYDLARLVTFSDSGLAASVRSSLSGDDVQRLSPERNVRAGNPPLLLLVGGDETPAMIAEQRSMASALRAVGGEVTTAEIPGEDHMGLVMHLSRPRAPALSELMTFIARHP
jgi:acetyl esterase/lipase